MNIRISDRSDSRATVVALRGELGLDDASELEALLTGMIDRSVTRIVVDVARLRFCDSIGLSTLADAHVRCTGAGGFVRLAAPTPFLLRILAVLGLLARIPVYDTVGAACAGDPAGLSRGS